MIKPQIHENNIDPLKHVLYECRNGTDNQWHL
jgi:hypothetical protein